MTTPRSRTLTRARIEIIPLIDVIFFLLATFVLFTLSLNKIGSIELTLPVSHPIDGPVLEPVSLTLGAADEIRWDGVPITMDELPGRLLLLRETNPTARVLIAGDRFASYASAVRVLDTVRAAGIDKVSIETRVRPMNL